MEKPESNTETSTEKTLTHEDIIRFMLEQQIKEEEYLEALRQEQNSNKSSESSVDDDDDVIAVEIDGDVIPPPKNTGPLPIVHPDVIDAEDEDMDIQDVRDSLRQLYAFKDKQEEASYEQMKRVVHEMMDNYANLIAERRYRISAGPGNYKRSRIATIDNSIRACEKALDVIKDRCPEAIPEITPYDFNEEIPINEELRAKKEAIKAKRNLQHRHMVIQKHQEIVEILGPSLLTERPVQNDAYFPNVQLNDAARNLPRPKNYKTPSLKKQAERIKQEKVRIQKEIKTEEDHEREDTEMIPMIKSIPHQVKKWFRKNWKKRHTKALLSAISLVISAVVAGIASNYTRAT